jgi:phosphatidylglycerophosphatase A
MLALTAYSLYVGVCPWKFQTLKGIPFIDLLKYRTAETTLLLVEIIRL